MPPTDALHMLQASLDPRQLANLGKREGLPRHQDDLDYLVHALLAALFGEGTVQPFRVMGEASRVRILGYSAQGADALREHADTFSEPADHAACDWQELASRPLPGEWETGRRLGFEVRACPVVRLSKAVEVAGKDGEPMAYGQGAEVDAWIHRRFLVDPDAPPLRREEVYHQWLADRLQGAARLEASALDGFRRLRLVRKGRAAGGAKRKSRVLERPEAVIHGTLQVEDGARFHDLLKRGIGRHKAFGFGMLLLRPPG